MDVLIIANYVNLPVERGNCRFVYLQKLLNDNNLDTHILTSTFCHIDKKQRDYKKLTKKFDKIHFAYEYGYKKNISISRIISHKKFAKSVKNYLKNMKEKPKVIYCAIPSIDVVIEVIKFSQRNNIDFVLDIQDLWPESFKMVLNIPIVSDIIFYPMLRKTKFIYKNSDNIVAVSNTFLNHAKKYNRYVKKSEIAYLGIDLIKSDNIEKNVVSEFDNKNEKIKLVYIGTLGTSYDIKTVIDALVLLPLNLKEKIDFIVIGDGPLKKEFEDYAKMKNINGIFLGRLDYEKMYSILLTCDIAVNPIVGKSVASIINKVCDYSSAALPVINTQNCNEYRLLLEKFNAGINCENGNAFDVSKALRYLIENKEERIKMGKNNRKIAEELFDRNKNYMNICNMIKKIIAERK